MNNWRNILTWQIQKETKDTRHLFDRYTTKKAYDWDAVKFADFYSFDDAMQEILLSKSVIEMDLQNPWTRLDMEVPKYEFIMHNTFNSRYYYVNTEGYDYPRYMFELTSFTN